MGIRGGGGEVEGFTFFAARYAETQQTTFQEFRSKYLLGFSYKKMYIFRINIKYSAKKSTRGSSCVNFPQTFLLLLWTLLKFHFHLRRTSASHICFWGFCYRKWYCLVFSFCANCGPDLADEKQVHLLSFKLSVP